MSEVTELEQQLKNAKDLMARRDMALKLSGNREFKKLILEDYLVHEAARLITAAGDPNLTPAQRADMVEMGKAAGHLKRYLHVICKLGDTAESQIADVEEAIDEARAEELAADGDGQIFPSEED